MATPGESYQCDESRPEDSSSSSTRVYEKKEKEERKKLKPQTPRTQPFGVQTITVKGVLHIEHAMVIFSLEGLFLAI